MKTFEGDVYAFPKYYDLVFGSDWKAEFEFLESCFDTHVSHAVHRIYEPACGTGRLMYRLGRAGYHVTGTDLNPAAVEYCNARLRRHQVSGEAIVADMSEHLACPRVDAAFNMINSFRHLQTESSAVAHLNCVANSLQVGGIYVLGLHLTPLFGPPSEQEAWSARKGNLCVNTRMWNTHRDLKRRMERFDMTYDVYTPTKSFQLKGELALRTYTSEQFSRLLKKIHTLELCETYDFSYDVSKPHEVTDASEDVVYILRKCTETA